MGHFMRTAALAVMAATTSAQTASGEALRAEVLAAERAFARSMADRDFAAFGRSIAADTVFFNGRQVLRGREAVLAGWRPFFDGAAAPFSWEPDPPPSK
jgi:ketosteroid isomerase-like protein